MKRLNIIWILALIMVMLVKVAPVHAENVDTGLLNVKFEKVIPTQASYWNYSIGGSIGSSSAVSTPYVDQEGNVTIASRVSEDYISVVSYDKNNSQRWRSDIYVPSHYYNWKSRIVTNNWINYSNDGHIYIFSQGNEFLIYSIDMTNGEVYWEKSYDNGGCIGYVRSDRGANVSCDGTIQTFDEDGKAILPSDLTDLGYRGERFANFGGFDKEILSDSMMRKTYSKDGYLIEILNGNGSVQNSYILNKNEHIEHVFPDLSLLTVNFELKYTFYNSVGEARWSKQEGTIYVYENEIYCLKDHAITKVSIENGTDLKSIALDGSSHGISQAQMNRSHLNPEPYLYILTYNFPGKKGGYYPKKVMVIDRSTFSIVLEFSTFMPDEDLLKAGNPDLLKLNVKDDISIMGQYDNPVVSMSNGKIYMLMSDYGKKSMNLFIASIPLYDVVNHWAQEELFKMIDQKVIHGFEDGAIHPDEPIKKGEFIALLTRYLYQSVEETQSANIHWSQPYINKAITEGIIPKDGYFNPEDILKREDMSIYLAKALHLEPTSNQLHFQDADLITADRSLVAAVVKSGIMTGVSKEEFSPRSLVTRAQAATVLFRIKK